MRRIMARIYRGDETVEMEMRHLQHSTERMGAMSLYHGMWMSVTWIAVVSLAVLGRLSSGAGRHIGGDEFYLAFMGMDSNNNPGDSYRSAYVFISNPNIHSAQVNIDFLGFSEPNRLLNLAPGETEKATLPNKVILSGTTVHQESVLISSDIDILVQAAFEFNGYGQYSMAGYPVLPTSSLTSEYIVATHCYTNQCVFVVTAVENDTGVIVHLRVADRGTATGSASYKGDSYSDGGIFTEILHRGQSFQVTCERCDMTGTLVSANGTLAVFGGGDFTAYGAERSYQDAVAEQMVPKETLGQTYVLGNNYGDVIEIVKVVVLETGGSFTYNGEVKGPATKHRQLYTMDSRNSAEIAVITSESPMLVIQVIAGKTSNTVPDVSMVIAVPDFQWSDTYQVYLPHVSSWRNVGISLVLHKYSKDHITALGDTVSSSMTIAGSSYDLMTMKFEGSRLLTIQCLNSQCRSFTGLVVVTESSRSSVFPLRNGVYIHPSYEPTTEAETTTTLATTTTSEDTTTQLTTTQLTTTQLTTTQLTTTQLTTHISAPTEEETTPFATTQKDTTHVTTVEETSIRHSSLSSDITTTDVTTADNTTPEGTLVIQSNNTSQNGVTSATAGAGRSTAPNDETTEGVTSTRNPISLAQSTVHSTLNPRWSSACSICNCVKNVASTNSTSEKAEQTMQQIREDLQEDKKKLSSYVRAKTSASDDRESARALASTVGMVLFTTVFCLVILPDLWAVCGYFVVRLGSSSKKE